MSLLLINYIIPRNIRGLQHLGVAGVKALNYIIPRNIRGLQLLRTCPYIDAELYHTKKYQGTTTDVTDLTNASTIISYQEISGDYNFNKPCFYFWINYIIPRNIRGLQQTDLDILRVVQIISYQEISGDYNCRIRILRALWIISYQEISGDYNSIDDVSKIFANYIIPRNIRGLQPFNAHSCWCV